MHRLHHFAVVLLAGAALALLAGCTDNVRDNIPGMEPTASADEQRDDIRDTARATLDALYRDNPEARRKVESAAGYAVFSNFSTKFMITGGGSGKGLAVNNKSRQEIFMRMIEVQAGLGFGVKKFRLVWVFETQDAFNNFVNSGYEFGGQAAVAAKAAGSGGGTAGAASVSPGVWVYQITDDGLAAEVTVKGTKYYRDKDLN